MSCAKDEDGNNKSNQINSKTTAVFNPGITYGTMTDQEGNIYKTVKIGTQIWMAENLKVTKYRNNESIQNITDPNQWKNLNAGSYCYYENNIDMKDTYGILYNWYAVDDRRNICPPGWHLPSDKEWSYMVDLLGGKENAGYKLKEVETKHWKVPNTGATNESGFTALPAGFREEDGTFTSFGEEVYFWYNTKDGYVAKAGALWYGGAEYGIANFESNKTMGVSIRCVKD